MLIPVRCTGCGKVISKYYLKYCSNVTTRKLNESVDINKVEYLTKEQQTKSIEGEVMDELGITHICCRTVFLTNA